VSSPDFGAFTTEERRAALVAITAAMLSCGQVPKRFPSNSKGESKEVKSGQVPFATAVWAKRYVEQLEYVSKPRDQAESAAPAKEGGADDTPF
jgi:hypothetical protein